MDCTSVQNFVYSVDFCGNCVLQVRRSHKVPATSGLFVLWLALTVKHGSKRVEKNGEWGMGDGGGGGAQPQINLTLAEQSSL